MNVKTVDLGSLNEIRGSKSTQTHSTVRLVVAVAMALWLAVVLLLGAKGAFFRQPGQPPLAILFGVMTPLLVFFTAYFGSSAFRAFILSADLRLGTAIHAWRVGGLDFLALYAYGLLPGLFAWPAGLGDLAIGLTAPWVALRLVGNPAYAASRRYVVWNILGIFDLVVAISLGAVGSGFIPGLVGNVTTTPMTQLPLILIPAYFVPFFVMLHFTTLAQARQMVRSGQTMPGQAGAV